MPTYDYRCERCHKVVSVTMTMTQHDQGQVQCPDCKGREMVPQYSVFFAKTSKKS